MIKLPQKSGEVVIGSFDEYFRPYAKIKIGDYLLYNPAMDKVVVVSINDRPQYVLKHIRKNGIFKKSRIVTIEKL